MITATLATTPLHDRITSMMMMETLNAYQRSQRPILYLNRWTRTVEEGATREVVSYRSQLPIGDYEALPRRRNEEPMHVPY